MQTSILGCEICFNNPPPPKKQPKNKKTITPSPRNIIQQYIFIKCFVHVQQYPHALHLSKLIYVLIIVHVLWPYVHIQNLPVFKSLMIWIWTSYRHEAGTTLVVSPVRINYLRKNTLNRCSPRTTASGPRLNGGRNLAITLYLFFIST